MKESIAVFIGSGFGGLLRFGVSKWINTFSNYYFPFGTFIVNLLACFILGSIIGLANQKQILSPAVQLFLTVGFCGGFSTFSTFSNEVLTLFQQGNILTATIYIFTSILLCVTATFGGLFIAERMVTQF